MRILPVSCCAALFLTALAGPLHAQNTGAAHTLTPQYQQRLRDEINSCAQKVNSAASREDRCKHQEDLCKKLLQAEDFKRAAQVAAAVHSTPGINAERRAVHHFLVAKSHAMQMEACTSVKEMEQARQSALRVAQEVGSQQYPADWGIGDAAASLTRELSDPGRLELVRAKVAKRQSGGVSAGLERIAAAQSAQLGVSATEARNQMYSGSNQPASEALSRKAVRNGIKISESSPSSTGHKSTKVSYSPSGAKVSEAKAKSEVLRGGRLKGPVIIDGSGVRSAPSASSSSNKKQSISSRSGIGSPAASRTSGS